MVEQNPSWSARSGKHYPVDEAALATLANCAQTADLMFNVIATQFTAPEDENMLAEKYGVLRGKTLSIEGIFGVLPSIAKQKKLSESDMAWFENVAGYFQAIADSIDKKDEGSERAMEFAGKQKEKIRVMRGILKNKRQGQLDSPG